MSSASSDPTSLLHLQSKYIHDEIKRVQRPGGLYALVIDDTTERVINAVLTKEQLLRIVTSIEKIDDARKQNSYMEGIYFVEMSLFNLKCIAADAHTARYKGGIGLFLPSDEPEVTHYFNGQQFMKNPKISAYFDGRINYTTSVLHPLESHVFLTDNITPNSMPIYYNENCGDLVIPQIQLAARALVNLVVLTEEMPLIRFYCPDQSKESNQYPASRLPELIADEYQRQIDDYFRANPDFPPATTGDKPRSLLIIVDRSIDLFAPLLHEFTYQAMAMDIVPSLERTGKYEYEAETETGEVKQMKAKLENETDDDWVALRHMHIIESSELIINRINELIKNNSRLVDRSKAQTSGDLIYIMANLKGFDEERRLLTMHKTLIDDCLDRNASRKLAEFAADFEQTCAAEGTSFEGERNRHLHDDLIVLLAREDLTVNDKMRLVLIYGLYRGGLVESDFIKLVKFIGVNDRQVTSLISRCFTNLYKVGFPIVKKDVQDPKVDKQMFHTINNEGTYNTSRFGPGVKDVVQKAVKHQLDEDWFPYFREKPLEDDAIDAGPSSSQQPASLRNNRIKASWAQSSTRVGPQSLRPRQRVFVYVAGGMTYSEMRSVYELGDQLNKDMYIGSESILRPRDFLIGLQSIDKVKSPQDLEIPLWKQRAKNANREVPPHLLPKQRPTSYGSPGMSPGMSPPAATQGHPRTSGQFSAGSGPSPQMKQTQRLGSPIGFNNSNPRMSGGSVSDPNGIGVPMGAAGAAPVAGTVPITAATGYRPPEPVVTDTSPTTETKKKKKGLKKLFKKGSK
ncbi:hypothetical protein DIURU_004001 [Diutina rugosa]|uniref:Sec1-like protein n=1 Tax=Diutina rugosa TaxID=5481 RepID=A0A642UJ83_DIURU|nr:uncharacterized protein DIURU_004001 [Diutina rugosa]KAA8899960.1 hypothetical protein DIURU_004001 [Diutina rugosa]